MVCYFEIRQPEVVLDICFAVFFNVKLPGAPAAESVALSENERMILVLIIVNNLFYQT